MKTNIAIISITLLAASVTQTACAATSGSQNLSKGIEHSVQAVGYSVAGSAQLASGAIAVPLIAIGSVGELSKAAGTDLMRTANTPIGTPLPVSDETVSAGPAPDKALRKERGDQ